MAVKGKDIKRLGWEPGPAFSAALKAAGAAKQEGFPKSRILTALQSVRSDPQSWQGDPIYGELADIFLQMAEEAEESAALAGGHQLVDPVPCAYWGRSGLDDQTLQQMNRACRLPVAVAGAQMPDGHVGYGLPIGGVLATRGAVIPYAVGVDIACRMKLSVVDVSSDRIGGWREKLKRALSAETRFGIGAAFRRDDRRNHAVMDEDDWKNVPPFIRAMKDKAWEQLGTSGSGNHFVEWGELSLDHSDLGLEAGRYLALLSHSGSRGFGAEIARNYTRIAMEKCPLPKEAKHLAWLALRSPAGEEYWKCMELAGKYASANHDLIHRFVLQAAGLKPIVQIENHHNFAWLEEHRGESLVVHRKGATPAGAGVLGVIPGSMADAGYVVRGRGNAKSLNSAAHGAGRRMSRKAAKNSISGADMRRYLADRGVELMAAGIDESPQAYKSIDEVMAAQKDLVEIVAKFQPRIVLMAKGGKAED
ncbi:RtcB family protein [bacterium]|nr:RtcB family protein [bacterium]